MNFCNCKEPELVNYDYHNESWCKLCGYEYIAAEYIAASSNAPYVPPETPWYVINVHTWNGSNFGLAIHLAILYYITIYPLFTLCVCIGKLNDWWDGLFNKKPIDGWPPPKAKHPKNLWN